MGCGKANISHPGYGCWLSGIDVNTQDTNQKWSDPYLAVVVSLPKYLRPAAEPRSTRIGLSLLERSRLALSEHIQRYFHATITLIAGVRPVFDVCVELSVYSQG